MESAIAGRRRTAARHSAEDQALDQIAKEVWPDYFITKQLGGVDGEIAEKERGVAFEIGKPVVHSKLLANSPTAATNISVRDVNFGVIAKSIVLS